MMHTVALGDLYQPSGQEWRTMLFEEHPWLLVPIIILVVEAWNAAKAVVRDSYRNRRNRRNDPVA